MLKRIVLLTAVLFAEALFADAIGIGKSRVGYPLIVPQVQKLVPASGSFILPEKLTVAAPEKFDLAPLAEVYAKTVAGGSLECASGKALCRFELTHQGVPNSPEGYTLAVTESGIFVRARGMRGLYYGMQTLGMMLRHRADAGFLKCCRITDWPDLQIRGFYLQMRFVKPEQIDRVCHVIDVLGSLKYNTLITEFGANFPYRDNPFPGREYTLSREDVKKILAAAKRNHMEVIPHVQLISHAKWLMEHRDWPKFAESVSPRTAVYCLSSPHIQPAMERLLRDTIDLVRPRHIHVGLDEIEQNGFPACPKCKAVDTKKLILAHLRPIWKMFADNGITPIVSMDQFFGFGEPRISNGLGITKVPEALSMNTVINSWQYWHLPSDTLGKRIRKRGFKNLWYMSWAICLDNCQNLPKVAARVGAQGNIIAYWSKLTMTFDKPDVPLPELYPSTIAQANYCWNVSDVEFSRIPIDSATVFRELLDGPPEWAFRGEPSPVVMDGVLNRALTLDPVFPEFNAKTAEQMKRIAAADKAKFELKFQGDAPLAVVLSGSKYDGFATGPVTIPVHTRATGASFLMTSALFNKFALDTSVYNLKRINIGTLRFVYADGKAEELPLVFLRNINDWNTFVAGNACRPVIRGNDRNGALFSLYAIDWRNPRPEEEIKEIVLLSAEDTMISPVLFAVSLSDAAQPPTGAPGAMNIADPPKRDPVKRVAFVNFRDGVPQRANIGGNGILGVKSRTIEDPKRGAVLEISVRECRRYLARVIADLPLSGPRDFESVTFDLKIDSPQAVFRPDFYLMGKRGPHVLNASGFFLETDKNWHTICIPRRRFGGKLDPNLAATVRVSFFMRQWLTPVTFRISSISYGEGVLPCRINDKRPVK